MGILNVTPDSFSDGGKYASIDAALKKAGEMVGSGAAIIDIGAESTRPGAEIVSESEELTRLIPAVEAVSFAGESNEPITGIAHFFELRNDNHVSGDDFYAVLA